jgi:hypothetical protein
VYLCGFLTASIGLLGCISTFLQFILARAERELHSTAKLAFFASCLGVVGLVVHAVVPLNPRTFDDMKATDLNNGSARSTTPMQDNVHEAALSVFFICSWFYITLTLYMLK